ncbi:hypothetical protein PspLS_00213 [Pyricularia sp. CBS 133598]|nr:hypothetical protein PspLS_00213 [Pyricularia sp. CBS 133598]
MPPNKGLVHLKEYDIKDSNVELIGSALDHRVKYQSAQTEPAWNDGRVGIEPGLLVWRIERFEVVPWPRDRYGQFYDGDSYIVLHSWKVGNDNQDGQQQQQAADSEQEKNKLGHEIFFWLGRYTTQDEAGTAAYKTVELDEFLRGRATQHRELQKCMSDEFVALFPRIKVLSGGVESGFRRVEEDPEEKQDYVTLLRVFKLPGGRAGRDSIVVHEVDATAASLDDKDVFVLDTGSKIWVWQGRSCSPMEKAKAAQVVHDMTLAKHVEVEVLSQTESRHSVVVSMLGGKDEYGPSHEFKCARPVGTRSGEDSSQSQQTQQCRRPRRLWRLSDASGRLEFTLVKDGEPLSPRDLDGNDVFLLDDEGREIWIWEGRGASKAEKASWLRVAQHYVRRTLEQEGGDEDDLYSTPIAKVKQGDETQGFMRALQAH